MLRMLSPLMMVVAVVVTGADRHIVRAMRDNRATSPEAGVPFEPRNPIWRWRLRRLMGRGVIRVATGDRKYLDESQWQAYRWSRRRRAFVALGVAIPLALLVRWYLAR